jgi:predicted metalloprotease with PDZ domain
MLKGLLTALVLLACQLSMTAFAAEPAEVRHSLSFPRKSSQYVHVRSEFPVNSDTVELSLPSWTPGSYLIRDFAGQLERLEARDSRGGTLPLSKIAKNRWRIDTRGISALNIDYDVWAGQKNVAESWIESDFALLNGAGLYLYSEQTMDWPQKVFLELPPSWTSVHTSLEADIEGWLAASDYDELIDSPIVAGNSNEYEFEVDGRPYSLVMTGENSLWDGAAAANDISSIVKAQLDFWKVDPFERKYYFLNLLMDTFGGLEHDHSTVMMCSPWQARGREDYIKWLGLVSHEFFHSWNVRRMRPEALSEYDYGQEMYTRELWLAEGLTSYYDNLLLFRAELIDVADYFELLADEFLNYETTPGREVRSAELASFDTWIKHYKPDNNKLNSTISYYRKGALIGFVTDTEIRRATANRESLDSVLRVMYSRYGSSGGNGSYPPGAFEDIVESLAGPDVRKMVENLLQTTADPDIDAALEWYGLVLNRGTDPTDNGQAFAGMGVRWEVSGAALLAEHVLAGYPGAAAGILPGDELLAIGGLRVTPLDYQSHLQNLLADERIEVTLVRHGRLLTLELITGPAIPTGYAILAKPKMNSREKKRLQAWLGRDLAFNR